MTCRKIRELMVLAAGEDLSARRAAKLEKHMAGCGECAREYRALKRSLEAARSLAREERTPEWSDGEWRKIMARATGQEIETKGPRLLGFPGWAWSAASAVLVIVIIGGVLLLRRAPTKAPLMNQIARKDLILQEPKETKVEEQESKSKQELGVLAPGHAPLVAQEATTTRMAQKAQVLSPAPKPQSQTVMAMTFVSQETGLKIYWVFNDAFDYKEKEK